MHALGQRLAGQQLTGSLGGGLVPGLGEQSGVRQQGDLAAADELVPRTPLGPSLNTIGCSPMLGSPCSANMDAPVSSLTLVGRSSVHRPLDPVLDGSLVALGHTATLAQPSPRRSEEW